MSAAPCSAGRVAVVIPTFNRAGLLPRAVDSALAQTAVAQCDIIVVDDGSSDDTPKVAARYGDRIRYVRQANAGLAAARNAGIAATTSEFIAFLDDDDLLMPDSVERRLVAFARWPMAVIIAGRALDRTSEGELRPRPLAGVPLEAPFDFVPHLMEDNFVCVPTVMIRRAAVERVGPFRHGLRRAEDYEMWGRVATCGPGVILDAVLAEYTIGTHERLSCDLVAMMDAKLHAHHLLRVSMTTPPHCMAWHRGLVRRLATARDLHYRSGSFSTAAGYGVQVLWHAPGRPAWEWGRTAAAFGQAAIAALTGSGSSARTKG
ncbi:MAG: glycosyltransferase [Phycisphaerales bacterium]|nr:glycosyltransferase [Phycisphaerales bacterium]